MSDSEDEPTLFEVKESHLDTGLRGIPVGTCRTSFVDTIKGVHYVGYPITDLAEMDPEDIIFLLFEKRLPNRHESQEFRTIPSIFLDFRRNLEKTHGTQEFASLCKKNFFT